MVNRVTQDYNDFMKWFKANHIELHDKFYDNIKTPLTEGAEVSIGGGWGISKDDRDNLVEIAATYYSSEKKK